MQKLTDLEYQKYFFELLEVLKNIHNVDISNTHGFGHWYIDGITEAKTWREYILAVDKYVKRETNLFESSFLEKELWDLVYSQMELLLIYCPEERYLVHGDFGSDNAMADISGIRGIFDWDGSKYGDFLYDIAWLNFWNPKRNSLSLIKDYYEKDNPITNFKERILCYQLRIGLSSLIFYAFSDQIDKYKSTKLKLLDIMDIAIK